MCVCAACHRGWLWLCWGGTEGDLATAHGGPGHSKSVSFGGDPSRLFKRVHYRLVNASAEGETLLTALNFVCTLSPSHSLRQTHAHACTHIFFSPLLSLNLCVFLVWATVCCLVCVSSVFFPPTHTRQPHHFLFLWISWLWPSFRVTPYHKVWPFLALIRVLRVWMCSFVQMCVCSDGHMCVYGE